MNIEYTDWEDEFNFVVEDEYRKNKILELLKKPIDPEEDEEIINEEDDW